jgi:hypothetical protein
VGSFYTLYSVFHSDAVYLEEVFKELGYQVIPASRKGKGLVVYDSPTPLEVVPARNLWFVDRRSLKETDWETLTSDHQSGWEQSEPTSRYLQLRPKTAYGMRQHYQTHEAIPMYRVLLKATACWLESPFSSRMYTLKNLDEMPDDEAAYFASRDYL